MLFNKHFVLYSLIGLLAALIDLALFYLFYEVAFFQLMASNFFSVASAALFSFFCNTYFNFKKSDFLFLRLLSFMIVVLVGYWLGLAIIYLGVEQTPLSATQSKILSFPFVFYSQFFLNSKFSFRDFIKNVYKS
jgi:putative flippase GtrA|tara:strand:+ start:1125 stop:1526 length:402 start_codon:yes stop_codon:yes gene_type:complete